MSGRKILKGTGSVTFSQALEAGLTHSGWLVGQTIGQHGREAALASHSVMPAKVAELESIDTYGPLFGGLSPSADLQCALENKLQARLDVNGSPEYALTWKRWDIGSGVPICALRASARYIQGRGFGGLPTPLATDHKGGHSNPFHPARMTQPGRFKNLRDYLSARWNLLYPPVRVTVWLMGYPDVWVSCGVRAMRSCRKSPRSS